MVSSGGGASVLIDPQRYGMQRTRQMLQRARGALGCSGGGDALAVVRDQVAGPVPPAVVEHEVEAWVLFDGGENVGGVVLTGAPQ